MEFLDEYGVSIFQYRPPPDPIDLEYYELRNIAIKARRREDRRTLVLVGERIHEFYQRNPGHLYSCFSSPEMKILYRINEKSE